MALTLKSEYNEIKRKLFDKYYSNLNDKQREAVYTVDGPLLILAGAGSGKTTVLVNRLGYIIRYGNAYLTDYVPADVDATVIDEMKSMLNASKAELGEYLTRFAVNPPPSWAVMAITFTNKAAKEIKTRLEKVFGEGSEEALEIMSGTFHSVCVRLLRKYGDNIGYDRSFSICDTADQKKQIQHCMKELNIDEKLLPVSTVLGSISRAKDKLLTPEDYAVEAGADFKLKQIAQIYMLYQAKLRSQNLLDFDDIIMQTVRLLTECDDVRNLLQNRYRYVCVDEFQDTNYAQLRLTLLLSGKYKNVMVVGDDDQSIYKFRGAVIDNIINFDKNYDNTKVIRLEENYRSTKTILNAANAVIKNNDGRLGKTLWTSGDDGEKVLIKKLGNQNDEARFIAGEVADGVKDGMIYKDFAVLYRANAQSRNIEQAFAKAGIPYRLLGGTRFYDRMEVKDIIAYLAIINNTNDDLRLRRIINTPRRGIGDKSIQIAEVLAAEEGCPLFEFLRKSKRYSAISTSTSTAMVNFVYMIDSFREKSAELSVSDLIAYVIQESGYAKSISEINERTEREERQSNLDELVSAAKAYEQQTDEPSLVEFLETVALVADTDKYDETADAVVLMTIHSSKGLEFPVVFLPGMEENIFPSSQTVMHPDEIEEERRLAYVALTRAQKRIIITHVRDRMYNGRTGANDLSRFAQEIPDSLVEIDDVSGETMSYAQQRQRFVKQKPTNYFLQETSKPSPTLTNSTTGIAARNAAASSSASSFGVGERVKHATFGEGVILSSKPMGKDTLLEIAFDTVGTKKLMATFAKLTKL